MLKWEESHLLLMPCSISYSSLLFLIQSVINTLVYVTRASSKVILLLYLYIACSNHFNQYNVEQYIRHGLTASADTASAIFWRKDRLSINRLQCCV